MHRFEEHKFGLGAVTTDDPEVAKAIEKLLVTLRFIAFHSYNHASREWRIVYPATKHDEVVAICEGRDTG